MDGISRSRGWDKEIPHDVLPMEQLVLSDKLARNVYVFYTKLFHQKVSEYDQGIPLSHTAE